jgi:outer membrane protein TolC
MKKRISINGKKAFVKMTFLIMILLASNVTAQERKISLSEALELSNNNNEKIKQYTERVNQRVSEDKAAKGNFLPTIDIMGGYTYLSENIEVNTSQMGSSLDALGAKYGAAFVETYGEQIGLSEVNAESAYGTLFNVLGQFPEYPNMLVDNQNITTATITATQPLFTGGKVIAAKKYAKAELQYADIELRKIKNEIANELIERYLNVVLLKQVIEAHQQVYDGMLKHKEQTARAIELEILPKHILLRAQVAVADAKKDLDNDLNLEKLALLALRNTINLPESEQFSVMDSIAYQDVYLDFEELLNTANTQQPVLGLIDQKEEMANQALAIEKSNFMPQIAAFGSYNMFRKDLSIIPPKFMVGVQAKMNLFNGFKDINNLKAKKHLQEEVKNAKEYAKQEIHLLVKSHYTNALNQQKLYNSLNATLALAKENLRINTRRFEEGLGKSIDVIDATLLYKKSKIEQLVALNDYYKAIANLYTAIGRPEEIVAILDK